MEAKISSHIESKYKVVGIIPGKVVLKNKTEVDLRTISMEQADRLFQSGFPYLKLKEKPSTISEAENHVGDSENNSNGDSNPIDNKANSKRGSSK